MTSSPDSLRRTWSVEAVIRVGLRTNLVGGVEEGAFVDEGT